MSRVGKVPVKVLQGVKVQIKDGNIKIEGPKGKLSYQVPRGVVVKVEGDQILVTANGALVKNANALHGLARTLINNMVQGVHSGFTKNLEIVGVGYRAATKGNVLSLNLGYSHAIEYQLPEGITAKVDANTKVSVTGADKILVGMVAAKIRSFKEPEPYQGKGVKYADEVIVRKVGKAAGAK